VLDGGGGGGWGGGGLSMERIALVAWLDARMQGGLFSKSKERNYSKEEESEVGKENPEIVKPNEMGQSCKRWNGHLE